MEFFSNFRISPLLYDLSLMDLRPQPVTFLPVSRPSDGASGSARFYGRGSTSPSPCLPRERDPAGVRGGKACARLLPTHAGARGQPHGHLSTTQHEPPRGRTSSRSATFPSTRHVPVRFPLLRTHTAMARAPGRLQALAGLAADGPGRLPSPGPSSSWEHEPLQGLPGGLRSPATALSLYPCGRYLRLLTHCI